MNRSTLTPYSRTTPMRESSFMEEWQGQKSSKFPPTIRHLQRRDLIATDFQMPDQSPRRGRGHFFEPTSFQRPFRPSLHQVPPIKHWHLRQSKIRTLDFQPTQNHLRREMKHFMDLGSNPESSRMQSLKTFYQSNRPSGREHSIQMQMQRKGRIDQAEMRRTFFKDVDVFGRR